MTKSSSIRQILEDKIDRSIMDRALTHFYEMKHALLAGDWDKCLARSGKFGEELIRLIHHANKGELLKDIYVSDYIEQHQKLFNKDIQFLLQHVDLLYKHRSKRGGAHTSFDPNEMDAQVAMSLADWLMAELIRIFATVPPSEAWNVVKRVTVRSWPLVEDIGGDKVLLHTKLSVREKICVLLYIEYPHPIQESSLLTQLLSQRSYHPKTVRRVITKMITDAEIYRKNGSLLYLTSKGRDIVEKILRSQLGT